MANVSEHSAATRIECPTCAEAVEFSLPRSHESLRVASTEAEVAKNDTQRYRTLEKSCSESHPIVVGFHW